MLAITAWKTYIDYTRMQSFSVPGNSPLPEDLKCTLSAITYDGNDRLAMFVLFLIVCVGEAGAPTLLTHLILYLLIACTTAIVVLTLIKANQHSMYKLPHFLDTAFFISVSCHFDSDQIFPAVGVSAVQKRNNLLHLHGR